MAERKASLSLPLAALLFLLLAPAHRSLPLL
jgi:hypothetical protein